MSAYWDYYWDFINVYGGGQQFTGIYTSPGPDVLPAGICGEANRLAYAKSLIVELKNFFAFSQKKPTMYGIEWYGNRIDDGTGNWRAYQMECIQTDVY
jgi:hypothetical protein